MATVDTSQGILNSLANQQTGGLSPGNLANQIRARSQYGGQAMPPVSNPILKQGERGMQNPFASMTSPVPMNTGAPGLTKPPVATFGGNPPTLPTSPRTFPTPTPGTWPPADLGSILGHLFANMASAPPVRGYRNPTGDWMKLPTYGGG